MKNYHLPLLQYRWARNQLSLVSALPMRTSGLEPWLSTPYIPTILNQRGFQADLACYMTSYYEKLTRELADHPSNPTMKVMHPESRMRLAREGWIQFSDHTEYTFDYESPSRCPDECTCYTWYYRPWYQRWANNINNNAMTDAWMDWHAFT